MPTDREPAAQLTHHAMGTVMAHHAYGPRAQEALAAACQEVARLEALLSRFLPASDIGRINAAATGAGGARPVPIALETYELLALAADFARRLPDSFDPTIAPLVDLWRAAQAAGDPPDPPSVARVLPLVDHRDLLLDPWARTARLRRPGQALDLGGIGKGYAGDRVLEVLREYGVTSAYANLGGNVVTLGSRPDGSPWQIGIQHPRREGAILGAVALAGGCVVTSGDYQRCFTDRQGIRRHHLLDPATGYPADSGLISVSIVADQATAADLVSTAVFIAGLERGLGFLQHARAEAILVDSALRLYVTRGLRSRFRALEAPVTVLD